MTTAYARLLSPLRYDSIEAPRSIMGQGATSVLDYVLLEHLLHHVGVRRGYVLIHLQVALQVEEVGVLAVVEAEHCVLLVAGPDVIVVAGRKVEPGVWFLSVEHDGEVLATHLRVGLEAHSAQYRWRHIVGRGVVVTRLVSTFACRVPYKEDGVGELGVERAGYLAGVTVLPESVSVIREHYQHGVVQDPQPLRLVEEVAQPVVGHRHLGGVTRVHPLELALRKPVRGTAARGHGLGAIVAVAVEVDVLLRRVPRLMRVVVVDEHEERLALLRHLQVLGRLGEHLRGEPVLLTLTAHGVRVVLVHDLLGVRGARASDQGVLHLLLGGRRRRPEEISLLTPDEVEGVEAPVHIVERPELVQRVCDHQVVETLSEEDLGEGNLSSRDRLPAPEADILVVPLLPVPERERPYPRVDRAPSQDGRQGLGVRAVEAQALPGDGVEVGGLYPVVAVDPEVVSSQTVYDHQYHVHSRSPARKVLVGHLCKAVGQAAAPGRTEHGSPGGPCTGHLEKVPAREGTLLHPSPPGKSRQATRASGFSRPQHPPYFCSARSIFVSIFKAFPTKSNQPPRIVANSAPFRRNLSPRARPSHPLSPRDSRRRGGWSKVCAANNPRQGWVCTQVQEAWKAISPWSGPREMVGHGRLWFYRDGPDPVSYGGRRACCQGRRQPLCRDARGPGCRWGLRGSIVRRTRPYSPRRAGRVGRRRHNGRGPRATRRQGSRRHRSLRGEHGGNALGRRSSGRLHEQRRRHP